MRFRIYCLESDKEKQAGEPRVVRHLGCSGTHHATWTAREYYGADGSVEYADDHGSELTGICDESCSPDELGGFIHEG